MILKTLCDICSKYYKCNYCITYGTKIGKELNATSNFCNTCKNFSLCGFCEKFGTKKGRMYYKNYVEYIRECDK